jgi:hypothetical protein
MTTGGKMNKVEQVEKYLKKYGSITNLEIMQMTYSICPHSIIRSLREKHGYSTISDEWQEKTRVLKDEKGNPHRQTIRYKKYIWKEILK